MPHQQVRTRTAKSPADFAGPLRILAEADPRIDIRGISTSLPDEETGEIGLILEDHDIARAVDLLGAYQARRVEEGAELYIDYAADVPGGLLAAIERARERNPSAKIKDIAIQVDKQALPVDSDGRLLRDANGHLIDDPLAPHVHGHRVQFFFEGTREA